MQTLVQDIPMFSRISTLKEPFGQVSLNSLFEELRNDMKEIVEEKHVEIFIVKLPKVRCNQRLMMLLFHNLLSNALKYSKKDMAPLIRVTAEISNTKPGKMSTPSEKHCRIFIEDSGIGFDQRYVDHIFGMFKRLHHHTEYEGTGIGLTLCKKIAEVHNGTITARSKLGKGSTFIVSLPVEGIARTNE